MKKERNHAIDILKGISIIMIITTHCSWNEADRKLLVFPYIIEMAVQIFMMLSGYVSAMTSFNKYEKKVILKKMMRFTVPFLIVWIIEIPILYFGGKVTIKEGILSLLTGGIGPGSYYYPLMLQFIFVFPLVYRLVEKYQICGLVIVGG